MKATTKRVLFWSGPTLLLVGALALAFRPTPRPVDLVSVETGPFSVTVGEDGESRVHDVYTVAASIGGRMLRIPLEVGDAVTAGDTVVAKIEPNEPEFLDPRAQAEREAAVAAAIAALELAEAEAARALAERDYAESEVERMRDLFGRGTVSQQAVDQAEREYRTATANVDAANATLEVREHEVVRARAALIAPIDAHGDHSACACVSLIAPVSGRVLAIHQKSETVVVAGMPLVAIGDPADLEIVVDLLSSDAVKVSAGQRAIIDHWGGEVPLNARVRLVEPVGFTKVSALGIEEQRVNVVLDLTDPRDLWLSLGHDYRVEVSIVVWEAEEVLSVPITALFRHDGGWAVFVETEGRAVVRPVTLGPRSGLSTVVEAGLSAGERVILHPQAELDAGDLIAQRGSDIP